MTTEERNRLIAIARAASPGPWAAEPGIGRGAWVQSANGEWTALAAGSTEEIAKANALFLETFNPAVVLALLEDCL